MAPTQHDNNNSMFRLLFYHQLHSRTTPCALLSLSNRLHFSTVYKSNQFDRDVNDRHHVCVSTVFPLALHELGPSQPDQDCAPGHEEPNAL